MTRKIYYEKIGRRYVPVAEYDSDLSHSYPRGTHLVICNPGVTHKKYNIDPNYAALVAAAQVAEDAMVEHLCNASEIRPSRRPLTQEESDAWNNLIAVWGDEARALQHPAVREVISAGTKALVMEADKLLQNPTVRKAYEKFLMVAALTKENK